MRSHSVLIPALAVGAAFPGYTAAQAITASDVLTAWDQMSTMVVSAAEAMPAEHFRFSPGEPLRNFADQINHTAESNLAFAYAVNAGQPSFPIPDRSEPPQDKAAVIDLLGKSFAHFRGGLAGLGDDDLTAPVPWGPSDNRRSISRLKAVLIVMSHLQREHGKTIMYLRAKDITPPPSVSW